MSTPDLEALPVVACAGADPSDVSYRRQRFDDWLKNAQSGGGKYTIIDDALYDSMMNRLRGLCPGMKKTAKDYRLLRRYEIYVDPVTGEESLVRPGEEEAGLRRRYARKAELFDLIDRTHLGLKHSGIHRTFASLREEYSNISRDMIEAYLLHCSVCSSRYKAGAAATSEGTSTEEARFSKATHGKPVKMNDLNSLVFKIMGTPPADQGTTDSSGDHFDSHPHASNSTSADASLATDVVKVEPYDDNLESQSCSGLMDILLEEEEPVENNLCSSGISYDRTTGEPQGASSSLLDRGARLANQPMANGQPNARTLLAKHPNQAINAAQTAENAPKCNARILFANDNGAMSNGALEGSSESSGSPDCLGAEFESRPKRRKVDLELENLELTNRQLKLDLGHKERMQRWEEYKIQLEIYAMERDLGLPHTISLKPPKMI